MAQLLGWALATLGFTMSLLLVVMSFRLLFAKASTVEIDFRLMCLVLRSRLAQKLVHVHPDPCRHKNLQGFF